MPSEKIQPFSPVTDVLKACNSVLSHFLQEINTQKMDFYGMKKYLVPWSHILLYVFTWKMI